MKDTNNNGIPDKMEVSYKISLFVRVLVLIWSASLITMEYINDTNYDTTFTASIFTGTLATFGIDISNQKNKKEQYIIEKVEVRENPEEEPPVIPVTGRTEVPEGFDK